jgi:hypothetical protein
MAKNAKYFVVIFLTLLFLPSSTVKAENPIVTEPTDYWFEYDEPTTFIAQTYMVTGYNSDPMLWLYNEAGTLLYSIDDSIGLQSYISMEVPAGRYRLRAGICCGNPDGWHTNQGWNLQYELAFNGNPTSTTTSSTSTSTSTTSTSTTSTTSTTTTTTTSTTSTLPPTTTSTSTTTTSTLPPTTTTTVPPTTTTTSTSTTTSTTSTSSTTTTTTVAPTTTTLPPTTTTSTSTSTTSTVVQEPVQVTSTTSTSTTVLPATTTTLPVILPTITAAEATAVATNPEALAQATAEEATQVFQALELETLSENQLVELVAAVQDAPTEVRESFEEEIDIFGSGAVDNYVPIGSTVPVKTRRALIAIGMVMSVAPAFRPKN